MSFSVRGFLYAKAELGICIFTVDSITNFHRIGGFKAIQIYYLQMWRPEVQNGSHGAKIKMLEGLFLLDLQRILFLAFSHFCRVSDLLGMWPPSSNFSANSNLLSPTHIPSPRHGLFCLLTLLLLDCPKSSFEFFYNIFQKNLMELFVQPNTFQHSFDYARHPGNPG